MPSAPAHSTIIIDLSPSAPLDALRIEERNPGRPPVQSVLRPEDPGFRARIAELCSTGRCHVRLSAHEISKNPVRWDDDGAWQLSLTVDADRTLTGTLVRRDDTLALDSPRILHPAGVLLVGDTLARFDHGRAYLTAATLRHFPRIPLVDNELGELLDTLYSLPDPPPIDLPADVAIGEQNVPPKPTLSVTYDPTPWGGAVPRLALGFEYGASRIPENYGRSFIFDREAMALHRRDRELERAAKSRLLAGGAKSDLEAPPGTHRYSIARSSLAPLIADLVREGWRVEASGVRYRAPGAAQAVVRSGIDWFDLDLSVDYGGATASLPALLEALRKRETTVTLSDGSVGLLPTDWLSRLGPALAAGKAAANATRFSRSQIGLLDALLAAMPEASVDDTFMQARARLQEFEGIEEADPPASFRGTLRHYQREGLGWLRFLREFGLGGCLADDMGLGKTVQVLALLAERSSRPSIIIVPRSLVFNWMREAERFTPNLRVLDYSGGRRKPSDIESGNWDIVLATYGTLRSDIAHLSRIEFEYAILDRRTAQREPLLRPQEARGLGGCRVGILDRLSLVENGVLELGAAQMCDVAPKRAVRCEYDIPIARLNIRRLSTAAAVVEHAKVRRESLGFSHPVEHERSRHDDDRWPRRTLCKEREHLNRLAKSHVVGETAAEPELAQEVQPAEPFALILAQRADEVRPRVGRRHALEAVQRRACALEGRVHVGFRHRIEQRIEQRHLRLSIAHHAVDDPAARRERREPRQPLERQHAVRAVR
jgi:hypothetical protein